MDSIKTNLCLSPIHLLASMLLNCRVSLLPTLYLQLYSLRKTMSTLCSNLGSDDGHGEANKWVSALLQNITQHYSKRALLVAWRRERKMGKGI